MGGRLTPRGVKCNRFGRGESSGNPTPQTCSGAKELMDALIPAHEKLFSDFGTL